MKNPSRGYKWAARPGPEIERVGQCHSNMRAWPLIMHDKATGNGSAGDTGVRCAGTRKVSSSQRGPEYTRIRRTPCEDTAEQKKKSLGTRDIMEDRRKLSEFMISKK
jgi:hypothetical protein